MSPSTANALVSVNPLELHIQSIICYRSYTVLAIDIYCNFPIRNINPLNAELNPVCYLLALLGAHHFLHVSRIRVKNDHLHFGNNIQVLKYTASGMSNRKRIGFMLRTITIKYY